MKSQHLQFQKVIKEIDNDITQRQFLTEIDSLDLYLKFGYSHQEAFKFVCLIKKCQYNYSSEILHFCFESFSNKLNIDDTISLINNLNNFIALNLESSTYGEDDILMEVFKIISATYNSVIKYGFSNEDAFHIISYLEFNVLIEPNISELYIELIEKFFEIQILNTLNSISLNSEFKINIDMNNYHKDNLQEKISILLTEQPETISLLKNSIKSLNI